MGAANERLRGTHLLDGSRIFSYSEEVEAGTWNPAKSSG